MHVLIVDDHTLFRCGLQHILSDLDNDIRFQEAGGVEDLAQLPDSEKDRVELVLLDMHLRGLSCLEALSSVKAQLPDATVVALSSEENPSLIRQAIEAGAAGFIPKASTPAVLIQALKLVLAGGVFLPSIALLKTPSRDVAGKPDRPDAPDTDSSLMTPRQLDCLMLAIQGKPNKKIARELQITEGTVKLHLSAAYRAVGVTNRTEAVFAAARMGLMPGGLANTRWTESDE